MEAFLPLVRCAVSAERPAVPEVPVNSIEVLVVLLGVRIGAAQSKVEDQMEIQPQRGLRDHDDLKWAWHIQEDDQHRGRS